MHISKVLPFAAAITFALAQDNLEDESTLIITTTRTIVTSSTSPPASGVVTSAGESTSLPASIVTTTIRTALPSDLLDLPWGDACVDKAKSILNAQPTPPLGQPLRDYFESSFSVFVTANLATSSVPPARTPVNSADIATLCEQWQTTRWVGQTVPASVTAEHESYKSAWSSWASAAGSALGSAVQNCEAKVSNGNALGQAVLAVATDQAQCSDGFSYMHDLKTPFVTEVGAETTSVTTTVSTGNAAVTSTTTTSTAGAARETGYVAAALIAAAGVAAVM
ncbi:hypothetical protein QBC40DRAFT_287716 [Triangularia verruculosa]|uniref:Infection structure specific protein n=1 Tax=Triangularia verruculosa TaxID=2587418 RepID=A0AAN6XA18_9PEZI|nr:hypothetical protein QBC40DRAFT_287716 [Triangularia verruculosa]